MGEMETRLLPWHFRVSGACEIWYSNYEIGWIDKQEESTVVCMYGSGADTAVLSDSFHGTDVLRPDLSLFQ